VAVLHCTGTNENSVTRSNYSGEQSCLAEHITSGGTKACRYGCLGHGDCVDVCVFDALHVSESGLPVVDEEKCTSCGKCVECCPRALFKLVPVDQQVYVLCSSHDPGAVAKKACKVACIGCSICVKQEDSGTFAMDKGLSIVNYEEIENENTLHAKYHTPM